MGGYVQLRRNLLQVYVLQKSGKGQKNEKVMAYFYLSPSKFCHYDYRVPMSCYSSFVLSKQLELPEYNAVFSYSLTRAV